MSFFKYLVDFASKTTFLEHNSYVCCLEIVTLSSKTCLKSGNLKQFKCTEEEEHVEQFKCTEEEEHVLQFKCTEVKLRRNQARKICEAVRR